MKRLFVLIIVFVTLFSGKSIAQNKADVILSYPVMFQKNNNGVVSIDVERFAFSFSNNVKGYVGRVGWTAYNKDSQFSQMFRLGLIHSGMRALNPDYLYFIRYGFEYAGIFESGKYYSGGIFNIGIKLLRKRKIGIQPEYNLMYTRKEFSSILKLGVCIRI